MTSLRILPLFAGLAGFVAISGSALAAGVAVGGSSLFAPAALAYSDTFTVGTAPRNDGLYNDNSGGAYSVLSTYGNPAQTWGAFNFSFNSGGGSTCCGYPGNAGAAGGSASSGVAQSGGGDFGFAYGLSSRYIVQADAVLPFDRFDITSGSAPGDIGAANALSVFFRDDGSGLPGIGIYSPAVGEVALAASSGISVSDRTWHNFAVDFDQLGSRVKIYVDESLKGDVDLTTLGGINVDGNPVPAGSYQGFSNAAVSMGGSGYDFEHRVLWADNFQVAGIPEPGTALLAGIAGLGFLRRRRA